MRAVFKKRAWLEISGVVASLVCVMPLADCHAETTVSTSAKDPANVLASSYIGSKKSRKLHIVSCEYVKKIDKQSRIGFNSIDEAKKAGYSLCPVCNQASGKGSTGLMLKEVDTPWGHRIAVVQGSGMSGGGPSGPGKNVAGWPAGQPREKEIPAVR